MKISSKIMAVIIAIVQLMIFAVPAGAASIGNSYITAAGACVMDYETGEVLYEYYGNTPRVPASMTKIMNLYCIYEALETGEITLDTLVPISQNVYNKSRNSVYQSVLPLYYNTNYTVDEMIGVIITYSASGAAIAMAELIGGSEAAFVERMNNKAAEMGLDAWYYDSCGIADNQISPISMAKLARNIINDYPDILTRSAKKSVYFHGGTYRTTNHLLDTYYYEGADGLKTGTTPAAGYCFCGTAVRDGRRMISVAMSSSSTGQRFIDTARLLDYGFAVAADRYDSLYFTNLKTFIDGNEVPTFIDRSKGLTVILAEDLKNYGFDVSYDASAGIVYAVHNPDKEIIPIAMDSYRENADRKAFDITRDDSIRVILKDGTREHEFKNTYNLNGYMGIQVGEFKDFYGYAKSGEVTEIYTNWGIKVSPEPGVIFSGGKIITSKSAYIMDYDTGEELFSYNADIQKPVASIAKMMSIYVILDAIKNGEIAFDTVVPISENVYNLSRVEDYKMMVNLEYDEVYTVDEMVDMIIIDSAAACVTAVAELLCGSEAAFVERMNNKAAEIGIGSVFYNGTGVCLNPVTDKENRMSAKEVAIMTKKMIEDYPEVLERTKCASVEFHGATYYNLNKLFTDYYYEGADGFKNGMTDAAGYCMCGTAMRDGKRIITVTLPSDSNVTRFTDTIAMFDYGFGELGVETVQTETNPNEPTYTDEKDIKINIDGNYEMTFPDQQPVIINGRTMIPIRALMETLEKQVGWNEETKQAIISDESITLKLSENSDVMIKETKNLLDGSVIVEEIKLDVAPVIIDGRMCMPIRAVAENFGMAVIWEQDTETILIIAGVC